MSLFTTDMKIKPHEKLLANAVIDFMREKYGFNSKIILRKTNKNNTIGSISLGHNSLVNDKFYLYLNTNQGYKLQIKAMIHELTHVKQVAKGELRMGSDRSIIWKNDEPLSVSDYNKIFTESPKNITGYKRYQQLPWELEADRNKEELYDLFINSSQYLDLKGKDINLDYIMDSLTERYIKLFNDFI